MGSSRLLPSQVSYETNPAESKPYTSVAGTVYDDPDTTYAVTGSVEYEQIQLIRCEGNYNFIQYKVDSNDKYKRGFLHYKNIDTATWKNLSAKYKDKLNNQTFYLRNTKTGKHLTTYENVHNEQMRQKTFDGTMETIYKFHYNESTKDYTILPVTGYKRYNDNGTDRVLTIRLLAGNEHPDRNLLYYNAQSGKPEYQRFWVAGTGNAKRYKIVPVSSYGTMTLANRPSGGINYVNQYYTTQRNDNISDVWVFEDTIIKVNSAQYFGKPVDGSHSNLCWAYSAKTAASAEGSLAHENIEQGVAVVKKDPVNEGGNLLEQRQITEWFHCGIISGGDYNAVSKHILKVNDLVHSFYIGHPVQIVSEGYPSGAHAVTAMQSRWEDWESKEESPYDPGEYIIGFYCSDSGKRIKEAGYSYLIYNSANTVMTGISRWRDTIYWADCNYSTINWK